ncbi:MAG: hypothetical protein F6K13_16920, partial [Okeania sp. SIO2B9]|nr:hypothetical protein [Okeania sp. SIO2B9]
MTVNIAHTPNSLNTNPAIAPEVNNSKVENHNTANTVLEMNTETLAAVVLQELQGTLKSKPAKAETIITRIAQEVERI